MILSLTDAAVEALKAERDGRFLRIAFTTGCGGSGYRLSYADEPLADDVVVETAGVPVALDSMAHDKLDGAVIDYQDEADGFILDHPDAVLAVWCG
jgi:iron-sulfur cluster assembly accessory protein